MSDGWGTDSTPDWTALAERNEREQARRKRLRTIGTAAAAALAVGGITVTAVVLGGGGGSAERLAQDPASSPAVAEQPSSSAAAPTASDSAAPSGPASASASAATSAKPRAGASATPSAPAAPTTLDPLTAISSAATDTAPLDPGSLFPAATLSIGGRTWTRLTDAATATCWQATTGGLGDVLAAQNCRTLLRVTYTSGSSAVTIGVAVLDGKAQADAANAAHQGQVQGLVKAGSTAWCITAGCANTHAAIGRYGYYTVSGTVKPGGNTADPVATAAGPGFADYARTRLLARGSGH
ncbi:hypothetical protein GCM10010441_30890 [Kitasatospora paracochleata]|uniref:Uncharacterized protein n=1 Tax=Kitasatospora paracochleata TaxID=58354 RepID=A0ABT1ITE2_9ACTN|nr:hypothetical protein [Kitasatospora paracochleata]MCP2308403.1 hypothetical protein [Kitasatospora paracochleata]